MSIAIFNQEAVLELGNRRFPNRRKRLRAPMGTLWHLCRDDGLDADGIVDELKEIRLLRRIAVVHEKARRDLATIRIKHMPGVLATDPPSSRDHLPPVPVVAKQLNNAFHAVHFLPTIRRHFPRR